MAPLAEVEVDPNEEDPMDENAENIQSQQQPQKSEKSSSTEVEKKKKRKEKKDKQGSCEKQHSLEEAAAGTSTSAPADPEKAKHNAVCPWEDE